MTRLRGDVARDIAGLTGGIQEGTEPAYAGTGALSLRSASNFWHEDGQLERRGGTRLATAYDANGIADVLAVFPFSQTGMVVITHAAGDSKHYAHAQQADGAFALPTSSPTENDSTEEIPADWNTATPAQPIGVELYESLYIADDSPVADRRSLVRVKLDMGALDVDVLTFDINNDTTPGEVQPAGVATYGGVLFMWDVEDESAGSAPALMRHSFLGRDPSATDGFDPLAYATIGAQGQPIRAAIPGLDILLVAKEAELYRISGSPDALPGWQFGIQPINASLGLGAVNARCLVFAETEWFGLGRDGPWRSNGLTVSKLRTNRDTSWKAVGDLSRAWVAYHPRRRAVLFGLPEASSTLTGDSVTVVWVWDIDDQRWAPDQRWPSRIRHVAAVAPSGVVLSDAPSDAQQVLSNGAFQTDSVQLRWTNGLQAPTEVWLASDTAGAMLVETVAAGLAGCLLTGLASGTKYTVTLRHVGALTTPFSGALSVYTQVEPLRPALEWRNLGSGIEARTVFTANVAGRTALLESTNLAPVLLVERPSVPVGVTQSPWTFVSYTSGSPVNADAWAEAATHPDGLRESPAVALVTRVQQATAEAGGPYCYQRIDGAAWSQTSIVLHVEPDRVINRELRVRYGLFGGFTGEISLGVVTTTAPIAVTIPGLVAGERYQVQAVRMTEAGEIELAGNALTAFTAVPVPTASASVVGVLTPRVDITVTPPGGKAGYDIAIGNLSGSFEAYYTGVASTPTVYQSTAGTCGTPDRYLVRARRPLWPEGLDWSPAVELSIASPCA